MIPIDLTGRTALVSGASQGLGAAIAAVLYRAGANVIVNYFPDPDGANGQKAKEVVQGLGDRAVALPADVRHAKDCAAMVSAIIERFKKIDIVVNNAGILRDRTLKNLSDDDWQSVLDTNLTGVFNICRAVNAAITDGGRIVNISSIAAAMGFIGQANYAAAKAGILGLTRVLSRELARRQITVNAIAPGVVLTDMGKSIPDNHRAEMLKSIPLGRFAEPREIADVVLFLCSDLASYITGQTLHVNGGWWNSP